MSSLIVFKKGDLPLWPISLKRILKLFFGKDENNLIFILSTNAKTIFLSDSLHSLENKS
jgi:hypothetical protein